MISSSHHSRRALHTWEATSADSGGLFRAWSLSRSIEICNIKLQAQFWTASRPSIQRALCPSSAGTHSDTSERSGMGLIALFASCAHRCFIEVNFTLPRVSSSPQTMSVTPFTSARAQALITAGCSLTGGQCVVDSLIVVLFSCPLLQALICFASVPLFMLAGRPSKHNKRGGGKASGSKSASARRSITPRLQRNT